MTTPPPAHSPLDQPPINTGQHYKLYRRRFAGLFGLCLLNLVSAMGWPWFGPIANNTSADFGITLDQVNWLGNIISCVYLPSTILVPWIVSTYGLRRCCDVGALSLLLSAWVRYAGTSRSLSSPEAYALLIMGQLLSAIGQAIYQVLGPKYSETWFGLQGRTTATMLVAVSNLTGAAIGQLMSPSLGGTRHSILILAIISTAALPSILLIGDKPPTPPTRAASQKSRSLSSLLLDLVGQQSRSNTGEGEGMTRSERLDFVLLTLLFGVFCAVPTTFSILSSQDLHPYGYSDSTSGLMGAVFLLAGIVAAALTAPLFDRVFTKHLGITMKVLTPTLAAAWLSLIWAIRPNNKDALFAIVVILGTCSVTLLPVALELGVELTRAADASSAILWFAGNLFSIMFILSESALRAGSTGSPPLNMHKALIFQAIFVCVFMLLVFPLKGEQNRRKKDQLDLEEPHNVVEIFPDKEAEEGVSKERMGDAGESVPGGDRLEAIQEYRR